MVSPTNLIPRLSVKGKKERKGNLNRCSVVGVRFDQIRMCLLFSLPFFRWAPIPIQQPTSVLNLHSPFQFRLSFKVSSSSSFQLAASSLFFLLFLFFPTFKYCNSRRQSRFVLSLLYTSNGRGNAFLCAEAYP